jgi:hypothetical protein
VARYLIGERTGGATVNWLLVVFALTCLAIFLAPRLSFGRRYPHSRSRLADSQFLAGLLATAYFVVSVVGLVALTALVAAVCGQRIDTQWICSGVWIFGLWTVLLPLGQGSWLVITRGRWTGVVGALALTWGAVVVSVTVLVGVLRPGDLSLGTQFAAAMVAIALSQVLYWRALRRYYRSCDLFRESVP